MWSLLRFLLGLLGLRYATGSMTIVISGTKTIKVTTPFMPQEVWINLKTPGGIPVCHAETDCIDLRLVHDGFILIVKLSSEYREIEWIAKGKKHKKHHHG